MSAPHYRPRRRPDRHRDPERAFYELTRPLRTVEAERFARIGVNLADYPIRATVASFHGRTCSLQGEFRAPIDVEPAFVLQVHDESGDLADLACWAPGSGTIAPWSGCAWALGQGDFPAPLSVLRPDRAIVIYRSPLSWLEAGRRGLVILDTAQARWRLLQDAGPFLAETPEGARELRAVVEAPRPQILIPRQPQNRSAA